MAFADRPTRAELRTAARTTLMDTGSRWWSDATLNDYVDDWYRTVNRELELVRGTTIWLTTDATSTFTYTALATDVLRHDAIYWNNQRLTPRSEEEMYQLMPKWRTTDLVGPGVLVDIDSERFSVWPPAPGTGGYLYMEYVRDCTFGTDTDTSELPSWTRYSCPDYVAWRAYAADGPLNDTNKAAVYRSVWERKLAKLSSLRAHFTPKHYASVTPGGRYAADILLARRRAPEAAVPPVSFHYHTEQVPSGTVNGTNTTFTLTYAPNPAASLEVEVNGITYVSGTHYTLSSNTVTFGTAYVPASGDLLYSRYRYTA